jgi:peptide deformylase
MSEILTIDTAAGIQPIERIDPLRIFGEDYFMLGQKIPEYAGGFPAPALVTLAKRLKMTMKLYSGLGLSANQCGVAERIFVIGTDDFQLVCVNPKVIDQGPAVKDKEGCLSYPGLFLNVERPSWIEVEFTDEFGEVKQVKLHGLSARCFLHELDHLDGIRYTSHVKSLALKMARQKANKIVKKIIRSHKNGNQTSQRI